MSPTKSFFRQVHLWLGLASGLLLVFVCLTGSVLAFEQEIEQAWHRERYFVAPAATAPLPPERLLAAVRAAKPKARVTGLKVYADPTRSVEISLAGAAPGAGQPGAAKGPAQGTDRGAGQAADKSLPPSPGPTPGEGGRGGKGGPGGKGDGGGPRLYLNPYTAAILGEVNPRESFFHTVEQLHRGLVAGPAGKLVMGINSIILLFSLGTGLVLWWPTVRRHLAQRLRLKWGSSAKRLTYDWHVVLGFYSSLFLLIIALTGVGMSFDWVSQGINKLTNSPLKRPELPLSATPAPGTATLSLTAALSAARQQAPAAESYTIQLPKEPAGSIRVATLPAGRSLENATDEVYLDQYSGRVLSQQTYEQRPLGQRIRGLFKPVHTGAIGGWPTKLLALVVSLLGATFPVTGTLMWLNRRRKNRSRPRQLQAAG